MKYNSFRKHVFVENFLINSVRRPSRLGLPVAVLRHSVVQLCRLFPVQRRVKIERMRVAGCATEWIRPPNLTSGQVILHIHGGAFFLGGLNTHRAFVSDLAVYSGCVAIHLDYPLAPEQPFPAAIDRIHEVYLALIEQGISAQSLIVSGDSCGANLALALCLRLKDLKQPLPAGILLQSPWLDLTLSSPSLRFNRKHDALLSLEALEAGVKHYLTKHIRRDNPQVSPMLADLTGLPLILLQVGSKEILLDDAKRFHQQARAAGLKVKFQVYTSMWHNFHMFAHWFAEAREALSDIGYFVKKLADHD